MSDQELQRFIYTIEPSRSELVKDPDSWTEEEIQIGQDHYAYLKQATEDGVVLLAGRSLDGEGPAIVVFEALSKDEAQKFMEADPFNSSTLMSSRLHPFRASLIRET